MLAQCKSSPNSPLTNVEELYSLGNKCTLPQAALHSISDMNLEIHFRTLTVITIKGVGALVSSQIGFSATAEIDYLEASILNRQGKEQIILASQSQLEPKDPFKQLQDVPVPQAELREPATSVRAVISANFQILKIDFLEWFCHGGGFHHCEVLLVTEKSAEACFMSHVNRSNVHWVWPNKRDIQILNGDSIWS